MEETTALERRPVAELSKAERLAYDSWCARSEPALSPQFQAQLFELFLNGSSCEEIVKLNPGLQLGSVVAARIRGNWDERRDEHLNKLLEGIRERVQQVTLETVEVMADTLAVANKMHAKKLKKYLQTGNPEDLKGIDFTPTSMRQYKDVVDLLMKLTGQDKQQKVSGEIKHTVDTPVPVAAVPINGDQSAQILAIIATNQK